MNDRYTKVVLTIIASCLLILTLKEIGFVNVADARDGAVKVTLCGDMGIQCGDSWVQYVRENPAPRY